jgi:hypothetical protein
MLPIAQGDKVMLMKVRRVVLIVFLLLLLLPGTIFAQAFVDHTRIDDTVDFAEFVPCAADGAGEWVVLSGDLHVFFHTTADVDGGVHSTYQFNPQGVIGIGQTTGDVYRGTGVSRGSLFVKEGEIRTETENEVFMLIGPGAGNNFLVHGILHYTVNANGDVTAFVDNYTVECK